ncbi:S26 family signal peptidase [Haloglomus irregulare]|jgi:signal peptidase|uniref:S26 family signal peptidase n=1 Tax=Haloglomus irregulare TaxID=2234134 RepID=A0A554NBB3_9EURY|nr:S26 family signal peptidase [Haloglomus irregulare]TSD14684.1 S26 family signal peptidase [Haloglomus irregulare]
MSDPGAGEDGAPESGVDDPGTADRSATADGPGANAPPGEDDRGPSDRGPGPAPGEGGTELGGDSGPETAAEWVRWCLRTDREAVVFVREVVSSVGLVVLVGLVLFGVSGLWPPMVAVESGSMNPNMQQGDLVFVMEEGRFAPDAAYAETGVVTYRTGQQAGYRKFELPGDVIVYQPNGNERTTPIIHRAHFWVNESENWVANGKADPDHLGGASSCGELRACPAPRSGFVTKGDNNARYDQVSGLSGPVEPSWVIGTAEFRIPWLGNIRLLAGQSAVEPGAVSAGAEVATVPTDTTGNATAAAP